MSIIPIAAIAGRARRAEPTEAIVRRILRTQHGVISREQAVAAGLTVRQLRHRSARGVLRPVLPGVFAASESPDTDLQRAHAALLWGGEHAALTGCTAVAAHGIEVARHPGVELAVTPSRRHAPPGIRIVRAEPASVMAVNRAGLRLAGVEAALVGLARCRGDESFEIAFEHARRAGRTSRASLAAYLDHHGRSGRNGVGSARRVLAAVGGLAPAESLLEVRADRLLRAQRWLPRPERQAVLTWGGRRFRFDFVWHAGRVVLETNGRRWHDDPNDFERDQQKWSVPGALGFRLILATWRKVVDRPDDLLAELAAALGVVRR